MLAVFFGQGLDITGGGEMVVAVDQPAVGSLRLAPGKNCACTGGRDTSEKSPAGKTARAET